MTHPPDLHKIERQVYASKFKDGLIDIQLGLMLIGGGIISIISSREELSTTATMLILVLFYLIVGLIPFLGKKWITNPRMGIVRLGQARKRRMRMAGWALGIMVLVQAILILLRFTGTVRPDFSQIQGATMAGLIFFIPLVALAYFNNFTRGYLHAILVGGTVTAIISFNSWIPLLVTGAISLVTGIVVFISFLRNYPLPEEGTGNV
ncbi:MAG: hypothetical protein KAT18_03375 [Candidatus Latescibacteria bacterium]|nr:hypothetical protein [Candidatus Latescibacterota bacterium]